MLRHRASTTEVNAEGSDDVRTTMAEDACGIGAKGTYTVGSCPVSNPEVRTSRTTPTTARAGCVRSAMPNVRCLPSGFCPGQLIRAMLSLITTTAAAL